MTEGGQNLNIYRVSRYAKSSKNFKKDDSTRQEDLLTGILFWCFDKEPILLGKILKNAVSFTGKNLDMDVEEEEPALELQYGLKGSRPDGIIRTDSNEILFENKVKEKSLEYHTDIKQYLEKAEQSSLLCITPDREDTIKRTIEESEFRDSVYWLSWSKVWEICQETLERDITKSKEMVIRELKQGIELQNLEPFEGFPKEFVEVVENFHYTDELNHFYNYLGNRLESIGIHDLSENRPRGGHMIGEKVFNKFGEEGEFWGTDKIHYEIGFSLHGNLRCWIGLDFEGVTEKLYENLRK